ncbi:MAG: orotidine-5'-phosphate decarboxylase [Methanomassiliicoccales archaeon]
MKKRTRIILALDVINEARALTVAEKVLDYVDAIKINWPLILATGPHIITEMARLAPVICDFKLADIPNTNRLIAQRAFQLGASGIIVHGFAGRDSVAAVVHEARGKEVFLVTEMSHPGGEEFTASLADRLATLAVEVGATGIIAPATRPERIARLRSLIGDKLILSPGVGFQGGSATEALRNGADFIIIGRSIYEDKDPAGAARRFLEEIQNAFL